MEVKSIWRHPIKSHGRELLTSVNLKAGESMPLDRLWAVAHDNATATIGKWAQCANFSRVSKAPELMAITSVFDETTGDLTLSHPKCSDLTFNPDINPNALIRWTEALVPKNRAMPSHIMRLGQRGYTDSDFPSVTLCNLASHRAIEKKIGNNISIHRWRGNIWFDNQTPWVEFDWIGSEIQVGTAVLRPRERTDRCLATTVNPETGKRDTDTLEALASFGHQDFSVRCEVLKSGVLRVGDKVKKL